MIKEKILEIVNNWQIKPQPEYRGFYCGKCLKTLTKAWHYWLSEDNLKIEVHLCKKCYREVNRNVSE